MLAWAATGLYPFDLQHVIDKLPQLLHSATSLSPFTKSQLLDKTPLNRQEFHAMLATIDFYLPLSFYSVLQCIKKASTIAFADQVLLQNSTSSLFKANLAKEKRKKKRKEKEARATYSSAFGRVFTKAQAEAYCLKEEGEALAAQLRKEAFETWKANAAAKKQQAKVAKVARTQHLAKQAEKKGELEKTKAQQKAKKPIKKAQKEEEKQQKALLSATASKRRGQPAQFIVQPETLSTQLSLPPFNSEVSLTCYISPYKTVANALYYMHTP
ncbi:hypothetical protein MMC22_001227 [Lobaria immixta]|nr:hypothetical protein [Lobaria immixta]